ncbi:MAG: hypothetical protein KGY99_01160 [Phycisphaerae bacterium]|nr:hypothetical protein [Phycisphaerae bacterium]
MTTWKALCVLALGLFIAAGTAHGRSEVSLKELLGDDAGRQLFYRKSDGALFYFEMRSGEMVRVGEAVVKKGKFDAWRGGINADGRRFLYQKGDTIRVVNDDGAGDKAVVDGANPHWWRDPETGTDYVVYNQDAAKIDWRGDGTGGKPTMRVGVDGGEAEQIWAHCYDAGLSADGTHIGDAYKGAFIGNRTTGEIVGNLPPDEQHCVGSMLPDNTYRMLYEKTTTHHCIVIADTSGKIVWSFERIGSGQIFGEASANHPDFCVVSMSGDQKYYLVRISTKHYADMGVSMEQYQRVGGPWVGTLSAAGDGAE